MTTATLTLTDFLLARIAADEAMVARYDAQFSGHASVAAPCTDAFRLESEYGEIVVDPARVLAECEAKRRVVERLQFWETERGNGPEIEARYRECYCAARDVALPFADHPDYDEAWRP